MSSADFLASLWVELLLAAALFGGMLLALELGYVFGRRAKSRRGEEIRELGTFQGAVFGLLGLLLGFTFAGAQSRFVARQDLLVEHANAIGTAYLRVDLLDDPYRSELHTLLRQYTAYGIEGFEQTHRGRSAAARAQATALQPKIWSAAVAGVRARPQFAVVVLLPLNEVIDLQTTRTEAMRRHLPWLVFALIIACSLLAFLLVGYSSGIAGHRNRWFTHTVLFLVVGMLWATIDLDFPHRGLIRMNQDAMLELQSGLK
jgi:hypothetical protein